MVHFIKPKRKAKTTLFTYKYRLKIPFFPAIIHKKLITLVRFKLLALHFSEGAQ
jgi:hypothetical protein